ncbi:MAG TPA: hypothetical protein VJ853_10940 [Thermoanaerobaculia bacterium]|nr:hypothetical protein [Thermoanaerobaculia bacterium]
MTWLRRFGRFAIAMLSVGGCLLVGGAVYYVIGSPKLTLCAGFGAGIGVYAIFAKLNLIPEDPDKLMTLSLTTLPPDKNQNRFASGT